MVNITLLGIRRNDEERYTESKPIAVNLLWGDMIIKAPEIIPCQKYSGRSPVRALHQRIHILYCPVLSDTLAGACSLTRPGVTTPETVGNVPAAPSPMNCAVGTTYCQSVP